MALSAKSADPIPTTAAVSDRVGERGGQTAVQPNVVLPQAKAQATGAGKTVQELHHLIEEALGALARAPREDAGLTALSGVAAAPLLGAAAGSELRYRSSTKGRIVKTILGIAALLVIGLIPLRNMLTRSSTEAFVNAPLYVIHASADGRLISAKLIVGSRVKRNEQLAMIEGPNSTRGATPVATPNGGKIWEVLVQPGDEVIAGQELARVVGCSAASVTASVSESVYDRLMPGMPARFNFYGSDYFYPGTLANMLGHSTSSGNLAISPASLSSDSYRVIVSVPGLGAIPNCAVGRRGEVVFSSVHE